METHHGKTLTELSGPIIVDTKHSNDHEGEEGQDVEDGEEGDPH